MKLKDTKLGTFLKEKAPKVLEIAGDLLPDSGTLGIVKNLIEHTVVDKADRDAIKDEIDANRLDFEKDMFKLEVQDRQDARANGNKHLQIVVAYFSLSGFAFFGAIQMWLCYKIMQDGLVVNEFIIMTASNIFGLFTGLIFTLKDFLFGGSAES